MLRFSIEGGSGGTPAADSGGTGMLGLDMALHHYHHQQQQQDQLLPSPAKSHDADHHRPHISYAYGGSGRGKQLSPEEEPRFGEEGIGAAADGSKPASPSPWHRMKWTDSMVRLLIMVVYCIGDDGTTEGDQHPPQTTAAAAVGKGKRAPPAGGLQQQQQQKKGKWKSVSRAMMEKGYHVSPQQCEDKFNDLNKRYKRVKELLGKGTAYRVVEDHALLDSMPHLTPKAKDEARRLLNSKHLFFREMCAYHTAGGGGAATSPSAASPPPPPPPPPKEQYQCFHHPSDAAAMCRGEAASLVRGAGRRIAEDDENDEAGSEDGDDDEEEGYDDDDGEEEDDNGDEDEGGEDEDIKGLMAPTTTATATSTSSGAKRPRGGASTKPKSAASPPLSLSLWSPPPSTSMQQLRCELTGLSGRGEQQHQRQWLRRRAAELGEQQMGYRGQALQLERQRFKWLRFSSNKEREMERTKLNNERLRLENERMLLLLHQKELKLISNEGGGAASSPAVPPTADRQTTN